MKIVRGKVNWWMTCNNAPALMLMVDKIPDGSDLRYEILGSKGGELSGEQGAIVGGEPNQLGRSFVYAESDGYVRFFMHNPRNENGFGGSVFRVKMKDGTERSFKGPWSSAASTANAYYDKNVIDVSLTDSQDAFERGYTFYGGSVTMKCVKDALSAIDVGREYFDADSYGKPRGEVITFPFGSRACLLRTSDCRYEVGVKYPDGTVWAKDTSDKQWKRSYQIVRKAPMYPEVLR